MGVSSCLCTTVLTLMNTIFLLLGLAILGVGAFLRFGIESLQSTLQSILTPLRAILAQRNITNINITQLVIDYAKPIGIVLIVIGVIIAAISILGIVAACCKISLIFYVYIAVLSVIVICQIIVMAMWSSNKQLLLDQVKKGALKSIKDEYRGDTAKDVVSLIWTVLNAGLKCCGYSNGADFASAVNWQKTLSLAQIPSNFGLAASALPTNLIAGTSVTLAFPLSCCQLDASFVPIDPKKCLAGDKTSTVSNFNRGCSAAILTQIKQYDPIINGIGWAIIAVQLLIIVFAVITVCLVKSE